MGKGTVKVLLLGQMEINMLVNIKIMIDMVKVLLLGQMEKNMWENI